MSWTDFADSEKKATKNSGYWYWKARRPDVLWSAHKKLKKPVNVGKKIFDNADTSVNSFGLPQYGFAFWNPDVVSNENHYPTVIDTKSVKIGRNLDDFENTMSFIWVHELMHVLTQDPDESE